MVRRLPARVAQLERKKQEQADQPRRYIVYVGDPEPEDIRQGDSVIFLPKKAPSAAAWMEACRQHWPDLMRPPERGGTR